MQQAASADTTQLTSLVNARTAALLNGDKAALHRILTDEFIYIDVSGTLFDKQTYIQEHCGNPQVCWLILDNDEISITHYGDAAFIVCRVHFRAHFGEPLYEAYLRSSFMYTRQNGAWRCASGHSSRIP
jgi:ketosteroid isomerase-like protein